MKTIKRIKRWLAYRRYGSYSIPEDFDVDPFLVARVRIVKDESGWHMETDGERPE